MAPAGVAFPPGNVKMLLQAPSKIDKRIIKEYYSASK